MWGYKALYFSPQDKHEETKREMRPEAARPPVPQIFFSHLQKHRKSSLDA
jgi:hypothetical protein